MCRPCWSRFAMEMPLVRLVRIYYVRYWIEMNKFPSHVPFLATHQHRTIYGYFPPKVRIINPPTQYLSSSLLPDLHIRSTSFYLDPLASLSLTQIDLLKAFRIDTQHSNFLVFFSTNGIIAFFCWNLVTCFQDVALSVYISIQDKHL